MISSALVDCKSLPGIVYATLDSRRAPPKDRQGINAESQVELIRQRPRKRAK
jgi:hypothetical protein